MLTPKYKVSIEDKLKNEADQTYTDSPYMASVIVTGIISSAEFDKIMKSGGRIVVSSKVDNAEVPFTDDYANGGYEE